MYWNNNRGLQLIEEADFREKVFQNINLSVMRRGTKMFTDCFKGAELVDMLLDQKLAKNEQEARALGQELLFQKHMECLYIPQEEECYESDFDDKARRNWPLKIQDKYPTGATMTKKMQNKKFRKMFKRMLKSDPPFRDGKSLYKLNIKGEIMTEHLQHAEISEPIIKRKQMQDKFHAMLEGVSFGLLGANNWLRRTCASLVCNKKFEYLVLAVIILSRYIRYVVFKWILLIGPFVLNIFIFSVLLALDEPSVDKDSPEGRFYEKANIYITAFFGGEMIVKMIAMTVISADQAYLRSGWNILDAFIVLISVISLSLTSVNLDFIRALRSLRALR